MTRSRRLALLVITFVPVVVLLVASGIYVKRQVDALARQAHVLIAGELQRQFRREVKIGTARAGTLGVAVLEDVRVAKGKALRDGELASARKVVVRYDWQALILGGKGAGSVSQVSVLDPNVLLIRRRDGTFNIAELLKRPPGPKRPPFRGKVLITGGNVTFLDYGVRPGQTPTPVRVHDMAGTIDAAKYPVYDFKGVARGPRGEFMTASFRGRYYGPSKRILVDVVANGVSAAKLAPYVLKSNKIQVSAGTLNTTAAVDFRKVGGRYTTSVTGVARVSNATVRLAMLRSPATDVAGDVVLAGNRATANLTASFAGARARAAGSIVDFANPKLDLTLDSPSMDARRLIDSTTFLGALSEFKPSGRGPVHARLTGSLSNLTVDATARIPRASVRGVPVRNLAVSALYRSGVVEIRSLRLTAEGATVFASGRVLISPTTTLALRGRFEGLDLRRVPVKTQYAVIGQASGTFSLTGPASSPVISVIARVSKGSVESVPFGSVEGNLGIAGSRVKVNDLRVSGVFEGTVQASGTVSGTAFDLTVAAESIDVDSLARAFGRHGYGGTAFFNGHVYGNLKSPHVQGLVEVFGGRADDYAIDHAVVNFAADRNSITVSEGLAQMYPAELRFSGEALGLSTNRVAFSGKADARRLEMTKLLGLLKRKLDVTGTVLGDFSFSGVYLPKVRRGEQPFKDVAASGSLSLEDATAYGYPVSTASAKLEYAGNVLKLTEASVTSDGARLDVSGSLSTDTRTVDATFDLKGLDLSRFQDYLGDYAVLAGTGSASGKVSGPLDNAKGKIDASVDGLAVNYEKFDLATAHFDYDNGTFESLKINVSRAGQSLELSGVDYNPETNCLTSANGTLTDISVPDILAIVRASPYFSSEDGKPLAQKLDQFPRLTSGRLNGSFGVSGCFESPEGDFLLPDGTMNLTATKVGVDVQTIDTVELRASAKSGVFRLDKFEAISGDASIIASGERAYENGSLNLEVRADNIALSDFSPWLGPRAPLGVFSAVFNIKGAASAPEITGSVEIIKPSYDGFTFDRLRASSVQIVASRIEIPDILLTAGGHQATAKASVPWDWFSFSIPNDEPISVSADMSKQDLSVLSVFVSLVDVTRTTGVIEEGTFQLSGTLLDPQMSGALKVKGGTIAFKDFTNTFTNVTADLEFTGDLIQVNAMSALSSEGGNVHIVPGGYATVGILGTSEVNLAIVADRLVVGEKNLLGYKEDVRTQIDAGLSVTGPTGSPTIADAVIEGKLGGITLSRGKLAFVLTPKPGEGATLVFPVNPTLNLTLRLGQDVEVAPPGMSLVVAGAGTIAGVLSRPLIALNLEIRSGEISLATARLRVAPGGTIRIGYDYPNAPVVVVDFQSTASVFAINTLGQRQRYQITMRVTGQASNPQINLTSDPPGLARAQMLAALGHMPALFTSAEAGLQSELASMLTAVGASTLLAPIENIFVAKLGFEQFNLEFGPIYPLSIYASRHLFGNFYIAFYRQLTGSFAGVGTADVLYQVVLSYRLKRVYQFSIGADNQQTLMIQIGYTNAFW